MQEFKEIQRFRQWWLWLLLSPVLIISIVLIVKQLIIGIPVGSKPMSDIGVYAFLFFTICFIGLLWYLQLETIINSNGILMNYRPFLAKAYSWKDINKVEIINYAFVGYGYRYSFNNGWIYNVSGNKGLKVYLNSGKYFTIGTQQPKALQKALKDYGAYSGATS